MTKIADISPPPFALRQGQGESANHAPYFICDFSPPRGASSDDLPDNRNIAIAQFLDAHFLSVPYNPGKSVYANSAIAAYSIKSRTGKETAFTLATRDMNILAAQSLLIGAALLGLQNVIVVRGDDFTPAELRRAKPVHDRSPTSLIRSIVAMNEGADFRGRALSAPTDFCIGAAIDTNRNPEAEASLTQRKIDAGAHFFITQPGFSPEPALQFLRACEQSCGALPSAPIFFGIQMIATGGRSFSPVPPPVQDALAAGASPASITIQTIDAFLSAGISSFYLMPPIFPSGARDYHSAQQVLQHFTPPTEPNVPSPLMS